MKKETITVQRFEIESAALYVYADDGRQFIYVESCYLDLDDYEAGEKYRIVWQQEHGQNMIYGIWKA